MGGASAFNTPPCCEREVEAGAGRQRPSPQEGDSQGDDQRVIAGGGGSIFPAVARSFDFSRVQLRGDQPCQLWPEGSQP